jgi:hypothetical protein
VGQTALLEERSELPCLLPERTIVAFLDEEVGDDGEEAAAIVADSALEPGKKAAFASVSQTTWRELVAEYKRRKAAAPLPAATDAVPTAPKIPGGRN